MTQISFCEAARAHYKRYPKQSRIAALRLKWKKAMERSHTCLNNIPMGQPVVSRADRNRRERAIEHIRIAVDIGRKIEEIEASMTEEEKTKFIWPPKVAHG